MRLIPQRLVLAGATLGLLLTSTAPLLAGQTKFIITGGGGVARFSEERSEEQFRPTFGGIIGLQASGRWGVDLRVHVTEAKTPPPGTGEYDLVHGEGNLNLFLADDAPLTPFITFGAGAIRVSNVDKFAGNAGFGFVAKLSPSWSIRADARDVMYKIAPPAGGDEKWQHQPEAFFGLALTMGGKPKDSDMDGVPDKADACPDTPAGASIDVNGCPLDSDKDGVFDGLDQCASTPRGAWVDNLGCPKDGDSDGVLDGLDKCASTPAGARVDPSGCPADSDGDLVLDGLDRCEGTAKGCTVDSKGCPLDSDADGVCDGLDKCPGTPTTARVDRTGCPIVVTERETELLETGMIRLQNINFATGKADILPDSYAPLDEVGELLTRWPELRIEIGGHCDSQGGTEYNQQLSEARASSVLNYLLSKYPALEAKQFSAAGYGELSPIADNGTALGRAKNRRVEFKVLNTDVLTRERERMKIVPR